MMVSIEYLSSPIYFDCSFCISLSSPIYFDCSFCISLNSFLIVFLFCDYFLQRSSLVCFNCSLVSLSSSLVFFVSYIYSLMSYFSSSLVVCYPCLIIFCDILCYSSMNYLTPVIFDSIESSSCIFFGFTTSRYRAFLS